MAQEPDSDHIRCLTDGLCLSARISGAGWKISRPGETEKFYPRLEFFDWAYKRWQVVWNGNEFQFYDVMNSQTPHHTDSKMQYLGCTPTPQHHSKKWQATYDKVTNKFTQTEG